MNVPFFYLIIVTNRHIQRVLLDTYLFFLLFKFCLEIFIQKHLSAATVKVIILCGI